LRTSEIRLAVLIALLALLDLMVMLLAVPLIPRWEQTAHLSHTQSGAILGAYGTAVLVLSLPAGHLADRLGARRLTIAATILFAATTPLYAFAGSFAELLSLRLAGGLFSAVSWTAGLAWLVASVPVTHRLRTIAAVNAAASGAAVVGPLVGGPVTAALGIRPTMLGVGAVTVAVALWALLEPNHGAEERGDLRSPRSALRQGLREPLFRQANLAMLFIAVAASALALLAPLHLHGLGVGARDIGWTFTAGAITSAAVALSLGRLGGTPDRRRIARIGCAGATVVCAYLALGLSALPYGAGVVAFNGVATLLWISTYPMCSDAATRAGIGQGIALGLLNTTWAFGATVAPVAAGLVADHADAGLALGAIAVAGLATAATLRPELAATSGD